MRRPSAPTRLPNLRRFGALGGPLVLVTLALGGGMAGCADASSGGGAGDAWVTPAVELPEAQVPLGHMHMPTQEEVTATWAARPQYVRDLPPDWQAAYAYALARPDVLQWLPCYCGCTGAGHRSNLDCFFQRREAPGSIVYEEHGSYCDICVETANLAARMLRQGSTIVQIRAAVDSTFGDRAPGTDTPMPPA